MSKSFQDTFATTKTIPRIRTMGRTFRVPEGQNVELPCVVDNLGETLLCIYYSRTNIYAININ